MSDGATRGLARELARPLTRSWWTLVAGVAVGLAAGLLAFEHAPRFATEPPGRLEVCVLGVVIGLIVFVGPPLVRSAVDPILCSADAVRGVTGVPVLAAIPRIRTPEAIADARRRSLVNVGLSLLSLATLALVATFLAF